MSLIVSLGGWGGFYFFHRYTWRICLGWVAVTWVPADIDTVFERLR